MILTIRIEIFLKEKQLKLLNYSYLFHCQTILCSEAYERKIPPSLPPSPLNYLYVSELIMSFSYCGSY